MTFRHLVIPFILFCSSILSAHAQAQFAGRWQGPITTTVVGQTTEVGQVIMQINSAGVITSVLGSEFPFTGNVDNAGNVTFNNSGISLISSGKIAGGEMTGTNTISIPGSPFPIVYNLRATKTDGGGGGNPTIPDGPANLTAFRGQVGQSFDFRITGASSGSIWGTDIYTDDSSLARAAVHTGLLDVGEVGEVTVTILGAQPSYQSTTRNGVTSSSYGAWSNSYSLAPFSPADFAITSQPESLVIPFEGSATLEVAHDGSSVTFQWYRGQAGDRGNPIPGATNATLNIASARNSVDHWVELTNPSGSVASTTASLTVTPPPGATQVVVVEAKSSGAFGSPVSSPSDLVEAFSFGTAGEQVIIRARGEIVIGSGLFGGPDGVTTDRSVIAGFTPLEERELDLGNTTEAALPATVNHVAALMGVFVPAGGASQPRDLDITADGISSEGLFLIGSGPTPFVAPGPGTLYLGINEGWMANNSGTLTVSLDPVTAKDGVILLKTKEGIQLLWSGTQILQSSPDLKTWTDLSTASSPLEITFNGSTFYQLRD